MAKCENVIVATWESVGVSAVGSSHLKTGTPCQDTCVTRYSADGEWIAVVVSDGAGSASRSQEGSAYVSKFFADELLRLVEHLKTRPPGNWISDFIIEKVLQTRNQLRDYSNSDDLSDFHCTLVACLQGPSGGFAVHLGDGAIVGGYTKGTSNQVVKETFLSEPENGEYANETYFVTESSWVKHLRIAPLPKMDWFICCTDGGESLIFRSRSELKHGFLEPVFAELRSLTTTTDRVDKLKRFLEDPQAEKVTGDDKTLVFVGQKTFIGNFKDYPLSARQIPKNQEVLGSHGRVNNQGPLETDERIQQTAMQQVTKAAAVLSTKRTRALAIALASILLVLVIGIMFYNSLNIFFPVNDYSVEIDKYASKAKKPKPESQPNFKVDSNGGGGTTDPSSGSPKEDPTTVNTKVPIDPSTKDVFDKNSDSENLIKR